MKEKITLSLDQHENARHGEEIFPLQKYVTSLWKEYPYVTAHWHEEAEFTRIEKGSCTYQIHLETYEVEEGDLIFIPVSYTHLGLVVLACYGAGAVLAKGIGAFMAYLPTMSANAGTEFSEADVYKRQDLESIQR